MAKHLRFDCPRCGRKVRLYHLFPSVETLLAAARRGIPASCPMCLCISNLREGDIELPAARARPRRRVSEFEVLPRPNHNGRRLS